MKTLILFFCTLLSVSSCSDIGQTDQEIPLTGTWQLFERYTSDTGQGQWYSIENGFAFTFKSDSTFISNKYEECGYGTYELSGSSLTLEYGCEEFTTGIETHKGTFSEKIEFKNGFMVLVPTYLNCIEGCGDKFKKVSND